MKGLVDGSGGMLAMHELFNHFIFRTSFARFYEADEYGLFSFPFACHLSLRLSKELRVNGILGTAKSLKDNSLKQAAEMEVGEGGTSSWYLGGIS
jgi:protein transport protein SEC23